MKLHQYESYDEYVEVQRNSNAKKRNKQWVTSFEVDLVALYIKHNIHHPKFGICHGVRTGLEVQCFREALGIEVIGTDISDEAELYPNVVEWDFHKPNPQWRNRCAFIYSNSLDHSYNPSECLQVWMDTLHKRGLCFIHWSQDHVRVARTRGDCFGATYDEYKDLLQEHATLYDEIAVHHTHRSRMNRRVIFVLKKSYKTV